MDPRQVGKYQILEQLGAGGMGTVYKALDPALGRTVALKLLSPGLQRDPAARERFLREARSAGGLQHPNIVVVHDLGEQAGELYIAMELLAGDTLTARLERRGPFPVPEALDVMTQIANALHYAHERGVIHRDVKPQNILVTNEGVAKLVDFGIARAGDQRLTRTGQVVGTVFYMSPEQINGKPLDGRSDQFSAAVVLYELLTGKVPFEGESTGATMMKIISEPMPPLGTSAPLAPPELETIIGTALAKDPAARFPTAAAFAKALDAIRRQSPTGAYAAAAATSAETAAYPHTPTSHERLAATVRSPSPVELPALPPTPSESPARKQRPWSAYLLAAALVIAVGLIALYSWSSSAAPRPVPPTPTRTPTPAPIPPPAERAPDVNGTYDLFQDGQMVGEMTIFDQTGSEFSVRAKTWRAEGHIRGREGYYDWRFFAGDMTDETGRTTFTVQPDGSLAGHVQGDKSPVQWKYLAKPRKKAPAAEKRDQQPVKPLSDSDRFEEVMSR